MMIKKINIKLNNQSGAALVIALLMMIALTLIGLASTLTSTFENQLSGNKRGSTDAFYTTDAGIEAVKNTRTNFDTSTNYVAVTDPAILPFDLRSELINSRRTNPTLNLPSGQTFANPPAVIIYHVRREGGEGTQYYKWDSYIIDSTGRDQRAGLSLSGSNCEIREKRLLRARLSEMDN